MAVVLSTGRVGSKKVRTVRRGVGLLAAVLEINQGLTDALKVILYLRVGVEVVLRVGALRIAGLALKAGEEIVDVGVGEQVVRRGSRNTGLNTGQVGGRAARRRISQGDRGATKQHCAADCTGCDRSCYRTAHSWG